MVLTSCVKDSISKDDKKEDNPINIEESERNVDINDIIGCWGNAASEGEYISYDRFDTILSDAYGVQFKEDFTLLEHKNISFCGTPPIEYGDYSGQWEFESSIITLYTSYWEGDITFKWKVIEVTEDKLLVEYLDVE